MERVVFDERCTRNKQDTITVSVDEFGINVINCTDTDYACVVLSREQAADLLSALKDELGE